jgi:hypothetical protein
MSLDTRSGTGIFEGAHSTKFQSIPHNPLLKTSQ